MTITPAEVVRHFLRLEAGRPKYSNRRDELLSWCELPDSQMLDKARGFGEQRDDVNPTLVYTGGIDRHDRHAEVTSWTREQIDCRLIFTSVISSSMRADLDAVEGNLFDFAQGPASEYPEFAPLTTLGELTRTVVLVAHRVRGRSGDFEAIDGAHRLVALCRAGVLEVDAYVAHML